MADSTDTNQAQDTATPMGAAPMPTSTDDTSKLHDAMAGGLLRPGADASKDDPTAEPIVSAPPVTPPVEMPKDILASAPVEMPSASVSEPVSAPVDIKADEQQSAPSLDTPPVEPPPVMPASGAPSPTPEETLAPTVAAAAAGVLASAAEPAGSDTPPSEPSSNAPKTGKKKSKKGLLMGIVALFFLVSTGLIFVVVTQRQQIADMRGRTAYTGFQCRLNDPNACNGHPEDCHCQNGDLCTGTLCEANIRTSCLNQGRSWCDNWQGFAKTCCVAGYVCNPSGPGCVQRSTNNTPTPTRPSRNDDTPTSTPRNTATHTPTHTPTNTPTGTPGNTPTNTPTGTPGNTPTNTPTGTPGDTPTNTHTGTPGDTATNTPTQTATVTPTQIVYATCNQACTVNADCGNGLVCLDSVCRNPSCSESASCQCQVAASPTPRIPVAGTGPTVLGASVIMGGMLLLLLGLLF